MSQGGGYHVFRLLGDRLSGRRQGKVESVSNLLDPFDFRDLLLVDSLPRLKVRLCLHRFQSKAHAKAGGTTDGVEGE